MGHQFDKANLVRLCHVRTFVLNEAHDSIPNDGQLFLVGAGHCLPFPQNQGMEFFKRSVGIVKVVLIVEANEHRRRGPTRSCQCQEGAGPASKAFRPAGCTRGQMRPSLRPTVFGAPPLSACHLFAPPLRTFRATWTRVLVSRPRRTFMACTFLCALPFSPKFSPILSAPATFSAACFRHRPSNAIKARGTSGITSRISINRRAAADGRFAPISQAHTTRCFKPRISAKSR